MSSRKLLENSSHTFFQKQMKENVVVPFYRRKRQKCATPIRSIFGHVSSNATTSLGTNPVTLILPVSLRIHYMPSIKYKMLLDSLVEPESLLSNPKAVALKQLFNVLIFHCGYIGIFVTKYGELKKVQAYLNFGFVHASSENFGFLSNFS